MERKIQYFIRDTCRPLFLAFRISFSRAFAVLQWLAIQEVVWFGDFMFQMKSRSFTESERLTSRRIMVTIFSKNAVRHKYIRISLIRHGPVDGIRWEPNRLVWRALVGDHYMYRVAGPVVHHLRLKVPGVVDPGFGFFASVGICRKLAILLNKLLTLI